MTSEWYFYSIKLIFLAVKIIWISGVGMQCISNFPLKSMKVISHLMTFHLVAGFLGAN